MRQLRLFDEGPITTIVNVASVPQLSPFRYPGGKTWLVPHIRRWLSPLLRKRLGLRPGAPALFVEPFAGGGIVSLTVANEQLARSVVMVELDDDVAAVWQTMLDTRENTWLADAMLAFTPTPETVAALLAAPVTSTKERALRTLVRNRVRRGGILAPGAGLVRYGEDGKGLLSRWYPGTLRKRIQHIATLRETLTFCQGDGLSLMQSYLDRKDAVFFLDPPYSVAGSGKRAGKRLYAHSELDHESLFDLASHIRGDFLMTYDDDDIVRSLAQRHGFATMVVPMKNTHHAKMTELIIGRDLSWAR